MARVSVQSLLVALGLLLVGSHAVAAVLPITAYQQDQGTFTGEVEVTNLGGSTVAFDIRNTSPAGSTSSIFAVYFENRSSNLLSAFNIVDGAGTSFASPATPANPPGADSIIGWGGTLYSADANPPPAGNGVNRTETLRITAAFSGLFSELLSALLIDQRIAFQIGDCVTPDGSCQAVVTPIPAALPLMLSAIVGLGGIRWMRRRGRDELAVA